MIHILNMLFIVICTALLTHMIEKMVADEKEKKKQEQQMLAEEQSAFLKTDEMAFEAYLGMVNNIIAQNKNKTQ